MYHRLATKFENSSLKNIIFSIKPSYKIYGFIKHDKQGPIP